MEASAPVKLTSLASSGGCAAKYSAARLETLLAGFVPTEAENLLIGLSPADDAAVYKLDEERALVFTVDFFPPIVDDPGDYGAIAATNALNDVFAMGGTPLLALSIAAFPEELPTEVLAAVFAAADEQVRAAGALLAGGHTIRDAEPKYGLAVVGTVHPDGIWPKSTARPGDAVFLTKPLGTGLIAHAAREGRPVAAELARAVALMRTLNRDAAAALRPFSPSAVTDVTGFGLFGHAHEMAERSGVRIALESARLPVLEGALELALAGVRTGGDRRNREFAGGHVALDGVPEELVALGYDPQTSGGLLVSMPADRSVVLEADFRNRDLFLQRIGTVEPGSGVAVALSVHVEHTTLTTRIRRVEVSPARFRKLAVLALVALYVVVSTGAVVRLTASGLGCSHWPRCGSAPFPAKGSHAFIEFSNRIVALFAIGFTLVSWLAARRLPGLPSRVRTLALAIFLGTVAQIPLGGLTVIFHLNPVLVISHFLLALSMLGLAVVVAMEAWSFERGAAAPLVPVELRRAGIVLVVSCLALVVTGTAATAAGPHSGGTDIHRLGSLETALYVHVRATAIFGLVFVGLLGYLAARRSAAPRLFLAMVGLLGLVLLQVGVGEIQWHTRLPWGLVLLHVSLAAAVWTATVALVFAFWRPPAPLAPRT